MPFRGRSVFVFPRSGRCILKVDDHFYNISEEVSRKMIRVWLPGTSSGNCFSFLSLFQDLCSNVRRISEFLEKPQSEEMIAKITHQCTFAEMKKNSDSFSLSVYPSKPSFLRKGEVGGWKTHFSEELSKAFDAKFRDKLNGTGLHYFD